MPKKEFSSPELPSALWQDWRLGFCSEAIREFNTERRWLAVATLT
jgi:hypothetical protein